MLETAHAPTLVNVCKAKVGETQEFQTVAQ